MHTYSFRSDIKKCAVGIAATFAIEIVFLIAAALCVWCIWGLTALYAKEMQGQQAVRDVVVTFGAIRYRGRIKQWARKGKVMPR